MASVLTRLRRLIARPAVGALAGQLTQAVAGLALQVFAARELGAAGLALFSVAYGAIVLATAVCSGLVGDSLTVLDRHAPGVRAGLHVWAVVVSVLAGGVGAVAGLLTGSLPPWAGLLLGLATAAFIVEDTLRRLLMAAGCFWSLPVVDVAALVFGLGTLALAGDAGGLALSDFVLALTIGQTAAAVVAWFRLPRSERPTGPWRAPDLATVFHFGVWRAAAQTIRPALLTVLRVLFVAALGAGAYGSVEAARVYTAPTLLIVAGLGTFLLPHFVSLRGRAVRVSLQFADRMAVGLALAVALLGAVVVVLLPLLGDLLTGGGYDVPVVPVVGWSVYAAASALLLPYSSMASVLHRQRRVLALRSLELLSLALVAVLVTVVPGGGPWAPLALSVGPVLAAVAVRSTVLVPLARSTQPPAPGPVPRPSVDAPGVAGTSSPAAS